MNEENIKMLSYWKEIVICVLLALCILSVQRCNSERAEKIRIQEQADRAKTITKVEGGRKEVKDREEKTYPVLNNRLKQIDLTRKNLLKKEAEIIPVSREEIEKDVQKNDVYDLADKFRNDGYPCTVLER